MRFGAPSRATERMPEPVSGVGERSAGVGAGGEGVAHEGGVVGAGEPSRRTWTSSRPMRAWWPRSRATSRIGHDVTPKPCSSRGTSRATPSISSSISAVRARALDRSCTRGSMSSRVHRWARPLSTRAGRLGVGRSEPRRRPGRGRAVGGRAGTRRRSTRRRRARTAAFTATAGLMAEPSRLSAPVVAGACGSPRPGATARRPLGQLRASRARPGAPTASSPR